MVISAMPATRCLMFIVLTAFSVNVWAQFCFDLFDESTTPPLTCSDANYFVVDPDGESRTDDLADRDVGDFDSAIDGVDILDVPPSITQLEGESLLMRKTDEQGRVTEFTIRQRGAITLGPRESVSQDAGWGNRSRIQFLPVQEDIFDPEDKVTVEVTVNFSATLSDPAENTGRGAVLGTAGARVWSGSSPDLDFSFAGVVDLDLELSSDPRFFQDFQDAADFAPFDPDDDDRFKVTLKKVTEVILEPADIVVEVDSFGGASTQGYESTDTSAWSFQSLDTFEFTVRSSDPDVYFELSGDSAFVINPGLSDAWFNDATPGQGFLIVVFPDQGIVFLAWFTYDTERPPQDVQALLGEPGHRWVTAQGPFEGDTAELTVFLTQGGVFDMAEPPAVTDVDNPIGTITIVWHDCENATLTYDIDPPGVQGEIPLRRIVPDNVALCEALMEE